MPSVFVGHGSPMNAIEDNVWSRGFKDLGSRLPRPEAILAISAHWYVHGTLLTANERPPTIHDFGGFPEPLYEMQYPAPGSPGLADRVVNLLGSDVASATLDWGLDHGTWSILHHMRPRADCPVVQLSIDGRLNAARHVEIGRALAPLRDEGVMILGSGNLVHNLGDAFGRMRSGDLTTPKWASDLDGAVAEALEQSDTTALEHLIESADGKKGHPTPEHFLPILYVAAAAAGDAVSFPITGFDLGSLSMRCVVFGEAA
jgi:4,5-DOPA dioxygenase extradiol